MTTRGRDLSEACFYDRCGECADGTCEDWCHRDQEYDLFEGWVEKDPHDDLEVPL